MGVTMKNFRKIHLLAVSLLLPSLWTASAAYCPISAREPTDATLFPKDAVILFQGDSVTDGNRGRSLDPNHIHGHGYVYLIASFLGASFPEQNWTFLNRGVSGNTLVELAQRWDEETIALKPDVLSVMIGVNDLGRGTSPEDYEKRYDALLTATKEKLPNVRLILIEPLWRDGSSDECRQYREIVQKLAKKFGAIHVPLQADFDAIYDGAPNPRYWVWDSVHPTTAGHWIIFQRWLEEVRKATKETSAP